MITRFSILQWSDSSSAFDPFDYEQSQVWPLVAPNHRLPPFQIIKTTGLTDAITSFKIIDSDGNITDITSDITSNGLQRLEFTNYDILQYTGTQNMTVNLPEGQYHAVMVVGTGGGKKTYYSRKFSINHHLNDMIKLSYWHDQPFLIPDGHISYVEPFYNFIYFQNVDSGKSVINKPSYPREDVVNNRDGFEFPQYFVSKKRRQFTIYLPEYIIDALRIAEQHHFRLIDWNNITYGLCFLSMRPGQWVDGGNTCPCLFEFEIVEEVVQTTGKVKPESEGFSYDQTMYDESYL